MKSDQHQLLAFWDRLRGGRDCPEESDLLIAERDFSADYLFHLDRSPAGQLALRTAGPMLVEALSRGQCGSFSSLFARKGRSSVVALIEEALDAPAIAAARFAAPDMSGGWELCLLPVRGECGEVRSLIGSLTPKRPERVDLPAGNLLLLEDTIDVVALDWVVQRRVVQGNTAHQLDWQPGTEVGSFDSADNRPALQVIEGGVPPGTTLVANPRPRPELHLVTPD